MKRLKSPTRAGVAFQEIVEPGKTRWNLTLDSAAGAAAAAVYLLVGPDIGGLQRAQLTYVEIDATLIRAAQRLLILGTVLAFAVWWLRQKLRDLRAHEHLAEDAAERVTMIETYAAMRVAGLQDANLGTVLSALYRPAMGGFSEDTGPVLPLEILLKSVGDSFGKKE